VDIYSIYPPEINMAMAIGNPPYSTINLSKWMLQMAKSIIDG